jgi:hypothetical protein
MHGDVPIAELWSQRVNPSDLYNIERPIGDGPATGGGQLYIQIGKQSATNVLSFLNEKYPEQGDPIRLAPRAIGMPGRSGIIEIAEKSAGRLRIPNQNRFRAVRHPAWAPENNFPFLDPQDCSTEAAQEVIQSLGGLHIFLAMDPDGELWAGFTTGQQDASTNPSLAAILSGNHPGGLWRASQEVTK